MADEPIFSQDGFITIHADDVVRHLARAVEGEVSALMVVAEFMVKTPAWEFEFPESDHLHGGAGGHHDRVATVHVTGADLHVCDDALGPFAFCGLVCDVILCFDDFFPELHELGGIVHGARSV